MVCGERDTQSGQSRHTHGLSNCIAPHLSPPQARSRSRSRQLAAERGLELGQLRAIATVRAAFKPMRQPTARALPGAANPSNAEGTRPYRLGASVGRLACVPLSRANGEGEATYRARGLDEEEGGAGCRSVVAAARGAVGVSGRHPRAHSGRHSQRRHRRTRRKLPIPEALLSLTRYGGGGDELPLPQPHIPVASRPRNVPRRCTGSISHVVRYVGTRSRGVFEWTTRRTMQIDPPPMQIASSVLRDVRSRGPHLVRTDPHFIAMR
jgi:hypothetical protein